MGEHVGEGDQAEARLHSQMSHESSPNPMPIIPLTVSFFSFFISYKIYGTKPPLTDVPRGQPQPYAHHTTHRKIFNHLRIVDDKFLFFFDII